MDLSPGTDAAPLILTAGAIRRPSSLVMQRQISMVVIDI
jgi:hypothetical protein